MYLSFPTSKEGTIIVPTYLSLWKEQAEAYSRDRVRG